MSALQKYYSDELAYLRDLGDEFARENPALAPFLSRQGTDPDAERLLEAFAFLTARLRQRLDDELPELSHSLVQVLWPQYLRPFPSATVVEFTTAGPPVLLPRDSAVQARPIDGTRCVFRTCFDTEVTPLQVADVQVETGVAGSTLRLRIGGGAGQSSDRLALGRLRLHLSAERDAQVPRLLYQWMRLHLEAIRVEARGVSATLPAGALAPVGFSAGQHLLAYPPTAFEGFRHVQEYFGFPEKFMFLDLSGLDCLRGAAGAEFTVSMRFRQPLPDRLRLTPGHVRLNCTPAVNLFPLDAQPLTVDHRRTEYRLRPQITRPGHCTIFSVDEVAGWARGRNERAAYPAFESFRHAGRNAGRHAASGRFHRVRIKPAVVGRQPETYLSFVAEDGAALVPDAETVSVALTCTNGALAAQVPPGGVDQATPATPAALRFRNISPVSAEIPAPVEGDLLWRLIANLSRNYGSLADLPSLRAVLGAYDVAAQVDQQARRRLDLLLEGLQRTALEPLDWIVRGVPVRGRRIRLTVAESKLGGEHEAYLLGCVLDAFFASYAAINSCHQLVMDGSETRAAFAWPVAFGARSAL